MCLRYSQGERVSAVPSTSPISCWAALLVRLQFSLCSLPPPCFTVLPVARASAVMDGRSYILQPFPPFSLTYHLSARPKILTRSHFVCNYSPPRPEDYAYEPQAREHSPCTERLSDTNPKVRSVFLPLSSCRRLRGRRAKAPCSTLLTSSSFVCLRPHSVRPSSETADRHRHRDPAHRLRLSDLRGRVPLRRRLDAALSGT